MIRKELLDKFRRRRCTPEELAALRTYFQQDDLAALEAMLEKDWEGTAEQTDLEVGIEDRVWARLAKTTQKQPKIRRLPRTWRAVAAAVAILIAAGTGYLISDSWDVPSSILVETYNDSGEVQQIALADGSTVWLNRNSQIRYERNFNDSIRAVTLEGEAFFEVAKNPEKPFVVKTGDIKTKVLGTSFNVRAFANLETIEVALVEGKVNVEMNTSSTQRRSEMLAPGDVFAYRKIDKTYAKEQFENDAPYAWRNDIIYFQRADVHEVAQTLRNWYDIKVTVEQEEQIQGTLVFRYDTRKMNIDQVLTGISSVMDYRFEWKSEQELTIKPD